MADRITPYEVGGKIEDRIDEIVLTGVDAHVEMLDKHIACMWLGDRMFTIYASRKKLYIALREGGEIA